MFYDNSSSSSSCLSSNKWDAEENIHNIDNKSKPKIRRTTLDSPADKEVQLINKKCNKLKNMKTDKHKPNIKIETSNRINAGPEKLETFN